jgi:hypothetical protein
MNYPMDPEYLFGAFPIKDECDHAECPEAPEALYPIRTRPGN